MYGITDEEIRKLVAAIDYSEVFEHHRGRGRGARGLR